MYVYVSVSSFVRCVLWVCWGKSREKSFNGKKQHPIFEDIFQKGLAFRENVVILRAVGRGHGMKNELIIKT